VRPQELAEAYLGALGRGDLDALAGLFSDGAVVHSPLYGPLPAGEFFPALFADTAESRLTLRGVTHGSTAEGTPLVTIWFHFDWQLPSGRRAPFDVVDVLELAADDRIAALHIVYDTADVRPISKTKPAALSRGPVRISAGADAGRGRGSRVRGLMAVPDAEVAMR
jgi:ketosteroid isomerase-like protein